MAEKPTGPGAAPDGSWKDVSLPEGCVLRRKQLFEYTTPDNLYDVELFENRDGTCYAIAVPREGPLVVYGSNVVSGAAEALQIVFDKIRREQPPTQRRPARSAPPDEATAADPDE
ncbi:MAG: hypothetical protein IRZ33_02270 [Alicyclobacillaceae bacterium]|nr:hypothetical protein [Alicyclobacillaceae bacterium]